MIVTVQAQELAREMQLLSSIVAAKPTIPVLANVLIQAEGDGLRLATTDLELGLVTSCAAIVHTPGITTLPAKHLLDILALLQGDVTLTLDSAVVLLQCGRYKNRIQTYDARDFPTMPSMQDLPTATLSRELQRMLKQVRFAVNEKATKYYMNGAQLSANETLTLAATDGHRLAYARTALPETVFDAVVLPSKAMDKLAELLGTGTEDILFAAGARHLFFVIDGRMLFSRMVEGKFPDYARIIPHDTDRTATFSRTDLQTALQRITLTATEVTFKLSTNVLTLGSKAADLGDAVEQLNVQYEGPDTAMTLNGEYILEFLAAALEPNVMLCWKGNGALLFTDGDRYAYVQMPLRTV